MQLNFTINIDERIVNFFKRICTRRNVVTFIIAAVIGTSIFVYAQTTLTVFEPDTVISSADVNANFTALDEAIGVNADAIAAKGAMLDSAGLSVGHFIKMNDATSSAVISPSGHYYHITWKGDIIQEPYFSKQIFFTGNVCDGTPFMQADKTDPSSGLPYFYTKRTYIMDNTTPVRIYIPKLNNGNFIFTSGSRSYGSYMYTYSSGCYSFNSGVKASTIELEQTTKTGLGLPAIITPPITINP